MLVDTVEIKWTVVSSVLLYCTLLYCTVLYCTVLYCRVLLYPAPMRPEVTTALPGPRVTQVRLYLMSMLVWMSDTNCTTTIALIVSKN